MPFDLSKKREERQEGVKHPEFEFEGKMFELPLEVPLQVSVIARHIVKAGGTEEEKNMALGKALDDIARILLRDQYDMFVELGATGPDVMDLLENLDDIYTDAQGQNQLESGESSASE